MEERYVSLDGTHNFRDIGGYKAADGRKVKMGLLYRSDELCYCTDEDIKKLEKMGLKSVIDYRNEKERAQKEDRLPEGVKIYYLDPKADVAAMASSERLKEVMPLQKKDKITAKWAKELMIGQNEQFVLAPSSKESYRKMFDLILDEKNLPLVQHCRGGKDRTGYGAALILLVLGVSKEDVLKDYMLTNYYKKEKNEKSLQKLWEENKDADLVQAVRYLKQANESFLLAALDRIEKDYGNAVEYVQKELQLTQEQIERLKDRLLTGESTYGKKE